jgi:putative FmdB family regulatory protein
MLMPTYEYECTSCGKHFEFFQNMTEPPKDTCPDCKGTLKRLMGIGAGIIFKGAGFYATDYRKKEPKTDTTSSGGSTCCQSEK